MTNRPVEMILKGEENEDDACNGNDDKWLTREKIEERKETEVEREKLKKRQQQS